MASKDSHRQTRVSARAEQNPIRHGFREMYRQLRVSQDLRHLLKEADNLISSAPGPEAYLCKARVELCHVVQMLGRSAEKDDANFACQHTVKFELSLKRHMRSAIHSAKRGAEEFASLLCARFYTKLVHAIKPVVPPLVLASNRVNWSDPQAELVEEEPHLCDFERWPDEADECPDARITLLRLEVESLWSKGRKQEADITDGVCLLHGVLELRSAGILYKPYERLLSRLAQLLQEGVCGHQQLSALDSRRRNLQEKHRSSNISHRAAAQSRVELVLSGTSHNHKLTIQQVLEYAQDRVKSDLSSEDCLACLLNLTKLSLDMMKRDTECLASDEAYAALAAEPQPGDVKRFSWVLPQMSPHTFRLWPELNDTLRQETVRRVHEGRSRDEDLEDSQQPLSFVSQVAEGNWGRWPGQAPLKLPPVTSPADLRKHTHMHTQTQSATYSATPLDEMPAGLNNRSGYIGFSTKLQGSSCMTFGLQAVTDLYLNHISAAAAGVTGLFQEGTPLSSAFLKPMLSAQLRMSEVRQICGHSIDKLIQNRGQLLVSLAEQLAEHADTADSRGALDATLTALQSLELPSVYRVESKLEGRSLSESDMMGVCETAHTSNQACDGFNMGIIDSYIAEHCKDIHTESIWWAQARQRFTTQQMRTAVLDEVVAAVKLLMDSQLFSCSIAAAISSHIREHLGPNFSWQDFGDRVYLEHASLLDLEPLQELLTFLWTQLGLKMHLLDLYIKAQQLLRHQGPNAPHCALEVHPGNLVQYNAHYLEQVCSNSGSQNGAADPQEASSISADQSMADNVKVHSFIHHIFNPLPSDSSDDRALPGCRSTFALQHAMERALQQEAKIARVVSKCLCIEREAQDVLKTFQNRLPNQTPDVPDEIVAMDQYTKLVKDMLSAGKSVYKCHCILLLNTSQDQMSRAKSAIHKLALTHAETVYSMQSEEGCQPLELAVSANTGLVHAMRVCQQMLEAAHTRCQEQDAGAFTSLKPFEDACKVSAHPSASDETEAVGGDCFAAMVRHALESFQSHVAQHVKPLMLLMDALAVQHKVLQKTVNKSRCKNVEPELLRAHTAALKQDLSERAREFHDAAKMRAADQKMQELIAAEEKPRAKKKSKRKKAAKQPKDKQQQAKLQPEAQKQQQAEKAAAAAVAGDDDDDADDGILEPGWINKVSTVIGSVAGRSTEVDLERSADDTASNTSMDMQKLLRDPRSEQEWCTVTTKQQRRKQAPPTQPNSLMADCTSVPGSWEDDGCQSRVSSPGLIPQSSPFHTADQGKVVQQAGWEAGNKRLSAGDAWDDNADHAVSFPQPATSVISGQQAMPEPQHQPSEVGASSQGSPYWEVPQTDADSCSQLSTDTAFCVPALKPADKQPTDVRKQRGRFNGGGRCDACDMSLVPAFLSAMPPGMPMPPSGRPARPQAQPQHQPQQQPPPQLQAGLQTQSQPHSHSQLQAQSQAQPQQPPQPQPPQPQPHPQLPLSGSTSSQGLIDVWDAGRDTVSPAGQHGSHQQPAVPQQERRRTTQQLTGWLAEPHKAEPDKQQLWVSKHATHVFWLPPAESNQEQPRSRKNAKCLPDYAQQAWPKRQQNQEPNNHNMHAHEQGHELTQKQQQVPTEPPVGLPGTQQAETAPKQQADGWDDSIADPPFNVIMQAPPLQDIGLSTSKSAKRSRALASQYSFARIALDDKPREHQTDLMKSQHHHDEKSAASLPAGSQNVSASTGAIITGHSALPKGIIQSGMGTTPPYGPPVYSYSNQPNAEVQLLAASAFLPNSLQAGRRPSIPTDSPLHPRDVQPDMEPRRPPAFPIPPKSHQPQLSPSSPCFFPMNSNGVQPKKGLLSPVAPSLHPPGTLFQLDPVLPSSKLDRMQPHQIPHTALQAQIQPLPTTTISQSPAGEQYQLLNTELGPLSVHNNLIVPPPVKAPARALPGPDSPQPQTHLGAVYTPAAAGAARPQLTQYGGQPWGEAGFAHDMLHGVHQDNVPAELSLHQASLASAGLERAAPPTAMQGSSAASGSWSETNQHKQKPKLQDPDVRGYDSHLEHALQAILAEEYCGVQSPRLSAAAVHDVAWQAASQQICLPESSTQLAAGLQNSAGEFNCFLNVIIQCLWYCTCFRTAVMAWHPSVYQGNKVVSALMALFNSFVSKEQSPKHHPLDPTALREALACLPGSKFQIGEMSDAGEVVMALYEQLAPVAAKANQPSLLDHIFGLHVKERVHCYKCFVSTHEHDYTQYFYNVMATGIGDQEARLPGQPLGHTLRELESHSLKSCDDEQGGCGVRNRVQHCLVSQPPKVFTMQLAWQTDNESKQDIKAAMMGLREVLDLADIYLGIEHRAFVYLIRSMVCYYGQHYMAYVLLSDSLWYMFDDARILQIGQWADVVKKCNLGRTQPSILFFEQGGSLQLQA